MFDNNNDTNPEVLLAIGQDPFNVILNVERQRDIGIANSGVNPGLSVGAQNGWVSTNTNEAIAIPGAFSTDPSFTQPTTTGSIGGTGVDPTGAGDGIPTGPTGGYFRHKEDPINDPEFSPEGDFLFK